MVAGMLRHLRSLRRMKRDYGWIPQLLEEAENERMHLLAWMKVCKPTLLERLLVIVTQGVFFNAYFLFYLLSPKTAHRFVGYLEEEACISYAHLLEDIDKGIISKTPAPDIAIQYWRRPEDATLRDVVCMNHVFSSKAANREENN